MKRFVLPSPLLFESSVNLDPQRCYNMPCKASEPLCTVGTAAGSSDTVERVVPSNRLGVPEVPDNPGKPPSFSSIGFPI